MTELTDEAVALLPCPFCGGGAKAHIWENHTGDTYGGVECVNCPAEIAWAVHWHDDGSEEKAKAIAAWNSRTPEALAASPEVAKLVAEAEARADKSHEKEIAVWSENYAALERDRNKWFEGAGAHHVASMKQAQRADRAEAALCAAQQRIKLLCDNDEWNLGLQEALEAIRAEAAAIRETKT